MEIEASMLMIWLLVGVLCGWLAARLAAGSLLGPVGNMVAGVFGAAAGGYLLPEYDYLPTTLFGGFIGGVIGAFVLLLLTSFLSTRTN
jgi:uncharacterized membrane protein YeaQ/YmgE (transglycosylase-associated protein family)